MVNIPAVRLPLTGNEAHSVQQIEIGEILEPAYGDVNQAEDDQEPTTPDALDQPAGAESGRDEAQRVVEFEACFDFFVV